MLSGRRSKEAGCVQVIKRIARTRVRIASVDYANAGTFRIRTGDVLVIRACDANPRREWITANDLRYARNLPSVRENVRESVAEFKLRRGVDVIGNESMAPIEACRTVVGQTLELIGPDKRSIALRRCQRLAVGVSNAEEQAVRRSPLQLNLQGLVIAGRLAFVQSDIAIPIDRPEKVPVKRIVSEQRRRAGSYPRRIQWPNTRRLLVKL